ncbi:hypothetical protein D3C85_1638310 [compost metagenome]
MPSRNGSGSRLRSTALLSWWNRVMLPASMRFSSSVVATVMSLAASCRHSSMVRTLWPTSRPMSHIAPMKSSTKLLRLSQVAEGSSNNRSMSECGNSWPRP